MWKFLSRIFGKEPESDDTKAPPDKPEEQKPDANGLKNGPEGKMSVVECDVVEIEELDDELH